MSKRKNWEKVTSSFLLKADPFYNKKINDCEEFVPAERTFFNGMYVEPAKHSKKIDEEIRSKILERTKNLMLCIKGYAGCGKSVYVQKLMYDFYPKNNNFEKNTYNLQVKTNLKAKSVHRLEIGAGTSSNDVVSRYIDDLSISIANGIKYDSDVFEMFCAMVSENDEAIKYIDNALILHDEFINLKSIKSCLNNDLQILKEAIRIELKKYDFSLLLSIDCLWRIAFHANEKLKNRKTFKDAMFFICFDNLDAIDNVDICRDFIKKLCEFRTNLDECLYQIDKHHKEYKVKTFVFILTCRNVTWGRLHLSEYAEDDDAGDISTHLCDYDISKFYEYVDIVEERIKYYSKIANNSPKALKILNEMILIKKLNNMRYIKERFKPLFNFNYRKCIDVITHMLRKSESYLNEAIDLAGHDSYSADDYVYSGSSSIFFRLVFDYFKEKKLFGYDIMDLVDLEDPYHPECENRILTSQARIVLMYIYNEAKKQDGGKTRLDQIFDYFKDIYSLEDICNTIYALFSRNSAWRRPINFSKRPLVEYKEKEDLNNQMNLYKTVRGKQELNGENFTKFEICQAGKEYIEFVIAHFEFFACRVSDEGNYLPPLFSKDSFEYKEPENKYQFEITSEIVLGAVERCCKKLSDFNKTVMLVKDISLEEYLKEPINKKTERKNPQLHEERVIFCHIYHLESYRNYILNTYMKDRKIEERVDVNKRLVTIISNYIKLYNENIISSQRNGVIKTLTAKISIIEEAGYSDFKTRIACDK